jgi:hypothetical protein
MAAAIPGFTPAQRARITVVLGRWADLHPEPDSAVITAGGIDLTPRRIGEALRGDDPEVAPLVYRLLEGATTAPGGPSLDDILESFERDIDRWTFGGDGMEL